MVSHDQMSVNFVWFLLVTKYIASISILSRKIYFLANYHQFVPSFKFVQCSNFFGKLECCVLHVHVASVYMELVTCHKFPVITERNLPVAIVL